MRKPSSAQAHADFSTQVARWAGNHWAFLIAAVLVISSLAIFGIEVTNIAISIGTLLIVMLLQNTQNRDSAALHLKLDEMVRVEPEARDDIRGVESRPAHEIDELVLDQADDGASGGRSDPRAEPVSVRSNGGSDPGV
jgi:low affinity Fe/Cu permease